MINKITVSEKRGLFPEYSSLGTIGEKNATTLLFLLPSSLQGYGENIVCETAQGSFNYTLSNDTFDLPSEVLTDNTLALQLVLKDGDKVIWKSIPYTFTLNPTLDDSGENVVEKAKSEQRETDRVELSEALTEITSEDLSEESWQGLLDKTKSLPLKTEQNVVDLTNYTALTYAFEHATTPPSLLTGEYKLDKEEPDVPESAEVLIKLPYLNTRNVTRFSSSTPISNSIEECSFDISSSPNANARYNSGMFQKGRASLRKLGLTGVEHINSLDSMFNNSPVLEEIALYVKDGFIVPNEGYRPNFYSDTFVNCRRLKNIVGDPLDMSVTTTYPSTFKYCQSLQYVRFKPKTINGNLDLSDCSKLMKGKYGANTDDPGTLLSIVNGVRDYNSGMGQITIKFSTFVKDYLTSWRCVKDDETGLYIASTQGMTLATVLTNYKGVIIA
ncbi:MAG: hypothetical protein SOW51_08515 [Oscillospiraceae bacterium]|nr:hypothetical protein [Oscillospiraceae bacterium]